MAPAAIVTFDEAILARWLVCTTFCIVTRRPEQQFEHSAKPESCALIKCRPKRPTSVHRAKACHLNRSEASRRSAAEPQAAMQNAPLRPQASFSSLRRIRRVADGAAARDSAALRKPAPRLLLHILHGQNVMRHIKAAHSTSPQLGQGMFMKRSRHTQRHRADDARGRVLTRNDRDAIVDHRR